jgi:hypothetical protein
MALQQAHLCSQLMAEAIARQASFDFSECDGKAFVRHARA